MVFHAALGLKQKSVLTQMHGVLGQMQKKCSLLLKNEYGFIFLDVSCSLNVIYLLQSHAGP